MTDHALQFTGTRKVAALMIALGTEASAKLLARLPEDAVDRVAAELMRTPVLEADLRDQVLEETYAGLFDTMAVLPGGEEYAFDLFREAYGPDKARSLLDRIAQSQVIHPFQFLTGAEPTQVSQFLTGEHPQTIALVLAHLDPRTAARILVELEPAVQADVAQRIAMTEQTTPEAVSIVEDGLRQRMSTVVGPAQAVGGTRPLAHVLNQVDRTTEKQILSALADIDQGLADEVRRFMFVFEDIALLDDRAMQRVVRELDQKDMALALRTTPDDVRNKFFGNMSQRAAEMLREEMSLSGQVRMKNVEEAQGRIVEIVKRLEDQDEIIISRGGGDDVLV